MIRGRMASFARGISEFLDPALEQYWDSAGRSADNRNLLVKRLRGTASERAVGVHALMAGLERAVSGTTPWQPDVLMIEVIREPGVEERLRVILDQAIHSSSWGMLSGEFWPCDHVHVQPAIEHGGAWMPDRSPRVAASSWQVTPPAVGASGRGAVNTSQDLVGEVQSVFSMTEDGPISGVVAAERVAALGDEGWRIKTLDGRAAWCELVAAFPTAMPPEIVNTARTATGMNQGDWLMPDWAKISQHIDVIYLTPAAYLEMDGALEIDGDSLSVAFGFSPGAAYWFVQPPFDPRVEYWRRSSDASSGWTFVSSR